MIKNNKIFKTITSSISNLFNITSITKYSFFVLLLILLSVVILKTTTNVFADEDTEAPTVPTSLHISMTSPNSVSLAWNASTDNVGVAGYRVTDNGWGSVDVTGLTHTFYNLPAGTHFFYVKAFDLAENLSGASSYVFYLSVGTTGPTPTPTPTNTPTPTFTPTPTNTPTPTPTITVVSFNPVKDMYVKSSAANDNEGGSTLLRVQNSGSQRSIVDFGTSPFVSLNIGASDVISAVLRVTIVNNSNNWGATGRTIDLHRVIQNWSEGNGVASSKGTGSGATWNCAIDSDISNSSPNCSGVTDWDMTQPNNTIWSSVVTDTETITNNQSGVVEFNVTSDVQGVLQGTPFYGWAIKRTSESTSGSVTFGSRESGNPPELVITYQ